MENLTGRYDEEQLISKQELLCEMHISSGQLYRWKRLGLIPQEWFIKQVTRTGQRTVFPRNLIETRVRDILKYKENYSLNNVERIVSPEVSGNLFTLNDLCKINEIDITILSTSKMLNKGNYTYIEILIFIVLTDFQKNVCPDNNAFKSMVDSLIEINFNMKLNSITFVEYKGEYFTIISKESSSFCLDIRYKKVAEYSLVNVSALLLDKYSNIVIKNRNEIIEEAINEITYDLGG